MNREQMDRSPDEKSPEPGDVDVSESDFWNGIRQSLSREVYRRLPNTGSHPDLLIGSSALTESLGQMFRDREKDADVYFHESQEEPVKEKQFGRIILVDNLRNREEPSRVLTQLQEDLIPGGHISTVSLRFRENPDGLFPLSHPSGTNRENLLHERTYMHLVEGAGFELSRADRIVPPGEQVDHRRIRYYSDQPEKLRDAWQLGVLFVAGWNSNG